MFHEVIPRSKQKYTVEFKANVLRLVANGKPIMAVTHKMGISDSLLHAWQKADDKGKRKPIKAFSRELIAYESNYTKRRWSARS